MAVNGMTQVQKSEYHAFLMRMWRDEGGQWRVTLQHARTRASYGFKNVAEAFAFVESLVYLDGEAR